MKFDPAISGNHLIVMDFDPGIPPDRMDCLLGNPIFEAMCFDQKPALDVITTVGTGNSIAARVDNVEQWAASLKDHTRDYWAYERLQFLGYGTEHPYVPRKPSADYRPRIELTNFSAHAGDHYWLDIAVGQRSRILQRLHPRLSVYYADAATKGIGAIVVVSAGILIIGGLILFAMGGKRIGNRNGIPAVP